MRTGGIGGGWPRTRLQPAVRRLVVPLAVDGAHVVDDVVEEQAAQLPVRKGGGEWRRGRRMERAQREGRL